MNKKMHKHVSEEAKQAAAGDSVITNSCGATKHRSNPHNFIFNFSAVIQTFKQMISS